MTPARQREKALFEEALNLDDPDERQTFLVRACGTDATLRLRLERLFADQAAAESFLAVGHAGTAGAGHETPPGAMDDRLAEADVHIGRYKLVKRLGDGGGGVVYLAEQQEPVRRQVALKIIRLGEGAEPMLARFQLERQALAWMDHPNIARVLDAGATQTGRPYFVMELVHGARITDYCNQHRLDVPCRLELFATVCQAIQHAHQKGVVHRDIKPSNILVARHDGVPVPKVIDFGIAEPVTGRLPQGGASSPLPRFAGTPDYVSPEQAGPDDGDVDTRSDIYSLGVLLYELLTGRTPFDSRQLALSDPDALSRAIRERPAPPAPSACLASLDPAELDRLAGQRSVRSRALVASVRGDLDCIVMRALAKDRRRRYDTANGLALDIRRYLDHEPVSAHPFTRLYHLRKLVRRNRHVYLAGAVVLTTLVAGLGASTWLFLREREARREQALLRDAAERARADELALRHRAEAREKIAHAAVALSHRNIAAADALVADITLDLIPPSLESAEVLRALGAWHAFAGRWEIAAQRFSGVARAVTRVDSADTDDVSRDLLAASAAICEASDEAGYEQFRQMAIARFGGSAKPIPSEHTIKTCLLRPADSALLVRLEPLAELVESSLREAGLQKNARSPYMDAWSAFALALFAYRRGDDLGAITWSRRSEAYHNDHAARLAASRLIAAMASHRVGRHDEARAALQQGRALVEARFRIPLVWGGAAEGFWFDWVNARLLLREASGLIEG